MSKKTLLSKLFISFDDEFYIATNGHYKQCSFNAFEQYSYVIDIFVSCCCVPILITTPPPPPPTPPAPQPNVSMGQYVGRVFLFLPGFY